MDVNTAQERANRLIDTLHEYAATPGFRTRLAREIAQGGTRLDGPGFAGGERPEAERRRAMDRMLHDRAVLGKPTLLDRYVRFSPDLAGEDRAMLERWRTGHVNGVFEVVGHEPGHVLLRELIDDLTRPVHIGHMDRSGENRMLDLYRAGRYVSTRLLEIGDDVWIFGGSSTLLDPQETMSLRSEVEERASREPWRAFVNPARRTQGREIVARNHARFVRLFDGWRVAGKPEQIIEAMDDFSRRLVGNGTEYELGAVEWRVNLLRNRLDFLDSDALPGDLWEEREELEGLDLDLVHHPVRGLHLLEGASIVHAALDDEFDSLFRHTSLSGSAGRRAELLRLALDDPAIPSFVFEMFAPRCRDLDAVWSAATGEPGFSWRVDGPAVLRDREPDVDPTLPGITLLPVW
ncbi:hypothetical protein GCM10027059_45490 [Myceligenerans halotolerans]